MKVAGTPLAVNVPLTLDNGENRFELFAVNTDATNDTKIFETASFRFAINKTPEPSVPPRVVLTEFVTTHPATGRPDSFVYSRHKQIVVETEKLIVHGKITSDKKIEKVELIIDDQVQPVALREDMTFEHAVTLAPGSQNLIVRATNIDGLSADIEQSAEYRPSVAEAIPQLPQGLLVSNRLPDSKVEFIANLAGNVEPADLSVKVLVNDTPITESAKIERNGRALGLFVPWFR